ncbi:hypothetical protein QFW96_14575 [Saccharopolyspora sp. TS4A08]|uniref:Uncharacterized protein n=1 Tax=Saccharopolyspora ipomoeae TaxID=3042027 RepID=A0ABT6PPA7_9PSEU|nr:hypothetical protein [Saccharopolyspora sp. TS4A08]MDI2029853.1 hypothetical protein [Saccharopolyspora sp. TS4A08]
MLDQPLLALLTYPHMQVANREPVEQHVEARHACRHRGRHAHDLHDGGLPPLHTPTASIISW